MSETVEILARALHARGGIGLTWQELPDVVKASFRAMARDDRFRLRLMMESGGRA